MAQFEGFQDLRFARLGIPPWKLALAAAGLAALGFAALVVATGFFLVAVPVVLIAGLAGRLFAARKGPRTPPGFGARSGPLIDAEYRVVSSRPMSPDDDPHH